jgi:hypothetical protein
VDRESEPTVTEIDLTRARITAKGEIALEITQLGLGLSDELVEAIDRIVSIANTAFVASLADDEALVEAVARAVWEHVNVTNRPWEHVLPKDRHAAYGIARAALRAVADHYAKEAT